MLEAVQALFQQLPFLGALLAGIVTFSSPCILPLVPGYLCFVSGASLEDLRAGRAHGVIHRVLFFIAGFTVVFVALGASASAAGAFLYEHQTLVRWVGGIAIALFGLHLMGLLPIAALYREKRLRIQPRGTGWATAFLLGLGFAVGWTPCVGPILGAILAVAATQQEVGRGMALLLAYSLGIGVPLLLAAWGINRFLRISRAIQRFARPMEIGAGAILVILGAMLALNKFAWLNNYFVSLSSGI